MSTIPNEQECIEILERLGAPARVIKHVCTVTVLAMAIAEKCDADLALVKAGGLLHDIGRTNTHGIRHGVEGVLIARSLDLPEPLVLIIQKHVGAGVTKEDARFLGLPDWDYMPSTLEEKIVCHADNLVGDADYLTSQQSYQGFVRKGLQASGERMLEMHRELSRACGMDIDRLVEQLDRSQWIGPCSRYLAMDIRKWTD